MARVHPAEGLGLQEGVLREVDPAAAVDDELVEGLGQARGLLDAPDGDVERDGGARLREGQQALADLAAVLEHRDEARPAELLEAVEEGVVQVGIGGHDALVLGEAAGSVAAVPVAGDVELPEEARRPHHVGDVAGTVLVPPDGVGEAEGRAVREAGRHQEGEGEAPADLRGVVGRLRRLGPAAPDDDAAALLGAACARVDPGDRHREGFARLVERGEDLAEGSAPHALFVDPRARDLLERDVDLEDVPREPHAAQRRPEQIGVGVAIDRQDAAVWDREDQPADRAAEGAVDVVVLAVDVRRHRAAQGDVAGTRGDGREPTPLQEQRGDIPDGQPRLGAQPARLRIEPDDPIGAHGRGHGAIGGARGQGGVAVGAAEAPREHGSRGHLREIFARYDLGFDDRVPPPAVQRVNVASQSRSVLRGT